VAGVAYIDSSALVKLVVAEPETAALEAHLAERAGLLASALAALECRRAVRRVSGKRWLGNVDEMLAAVVLLDVTPALLEAAAQLDPPLLRSLDAIHVATALAAHDPDLEVITYDDRLAQAATANGLKVVRPGAKK
jgi:predicted nucleic acid-binding protein